MQKLKLAWRYVDVDWIQLKKTLPLEFPFNLAQIMLNVQLEMVKQHAWQDSSLFFYHSFNREKVIG